MTDISNLAPKISGPAQDALTQLRRALAENKELVAANRILTLNMTDSQALNALERWFAKNRRRGVVY